MLVEIVMPRLSDSMEEGVILKWLKSVGDQVGRGEDLVEIETDKANMVYASDTTGVLAEILAEEGATLPVGSVIAKIEKDGEETAPPDSEEDSKENVEELPQQERRAEEKPSQPPPDKISEGERVKVSPVARRLAKEKGIDLDTVEGSGPGGRILKEDVERLVGDVSAKSEEATEPAAKGQVTVVELNRMQQTVARRMAESKATIPDFVLNLDIETAALTALRQRLKETAEGSVPSYNDAIVKATALALRDFPKLNGSYKDGRFELYSRINVGIAVATKDGLIVPTLFDADQKSLAETAELVRALAERVRSGMVTPPELAGGTFTVSNLGMYGVRNFNAIINPPQSAILAVGAVREGSNALMTLTLSCDHRIVYGTDGAEFLGRLKELLEDPKAL